MRPSPLPVFSTAQFSFDKETSEFVTEASNLYVDANGVDQRGLYFLTRQFKLKSAKTGKEMCCAHRQTHIDDENDITHWEFVVFDPALDGAITDLKVTIFND